MLLLLLLLLFALVLHGDHDLIRLVDQIQRTNEHRIGPGRNDKEEPGLDNSEE